MGGERIDGAANLLLLRSLGRPERDATVAGVGHDADRVLSGESVDEQAERFLDQWQPVRFIHGTGGVDEEHQVSRRHLFRIDLAGLHADANEVVGAVPRARAEFEVEGDGVVALRLGVGVGEVVDELGEEHGVLDGQLMLVEEEAADVGVRRGVDVGGERGECGDLRRAELVLAVRAVLLGVGLVEFAGGSGKRSLRIVLRVPSDFARITFPVRPRSQRFLLAHDAPGLFEICFLRMYFTLEPASFFFPRAGAAHDDGVL